MFGHAQTAFLRYNSGMEGDMVNILRHEDVERLTAQARLDALLDEITIRITGTSFEPLTPIDPRCVEVGTTVWLDKASGRIYRAIPRQPGPPDGMVLGLIKVVNGNEITVVFGR